MIDYLLRFDTPESVPQMPEGYESGTPSWDDENGRTFMPVQVFKELTPGDYSDPENPVNPEVEYAPGHWAAVATVTPDDDLWDSFPAVHEVDRASGAVLRTRLSPEQMAYGWQVSPVFAGSTYAFTGAGDGE